MEHFNYFFGADNDNHYQIQWSERFLFHKTDPTPLRSVINLYEEEFM